MAQPVEQQPKPRCDALAHIFAKRLGVGLRSRRGARRDDHVARPCIVQYRVNKRNTSNLKAQIMVEMHVASAADWHTKALRSGGKSCGCLPVNGSVRYTCSRLRSDVRSRQRWCLETDVVQRIMRRGAARREMRWCPGTKPGSRLSEIPQRRCVRAFDSVSGEHRSSRGGVLIRDYCYRAWSCQMRYCRSSRKHWLLLWRLPGTRSFDCMILNAISW
jgi:hypothetical protein